jgi:hypothetical protein
MKSARRTIRSRALGWVSTLLLATVGPSLAGAETVALDPVTAHVVPDEAAVHGDHPWVRMEVACDHVLRYEACEGSLVLLGWSSRSGGGKVPKWGQRTYKLPADTTRIIALRVNHFPIEQLEEHHRITTVISVTTQWNQVSKKLVLDWSLE